MVCCGYVCANGCSPASAACWSSCVGSASPDPLNAERSTENAPAAPKSVASAKSGRYSGKASGRASENRGQKFSCPNAPRVPTPLIWPNDVAKSRAIPPMNDRSRVTAVTAMTISAPPLVMRPAPFTYRVTARKATSAPTRLAMNPKPQMMSQRTTPIGTVRSDRRVPRPTLLPGAVYGRTGSVWPRPGWYWPGWYWPGWYWPGWGDGTVTGAPRGRAGTIRGEKATG